MHSFFFVNDNGKLKCKENNDENRNNFFFRIFIPNIIFIENKPIKSE